METILNILETIVVLGGLLLFGAMLLIELEHEIACRNRQKDQQNEGEDSDEGDL